MSYGLQLKTKAEQDILEAATWYEDQQPGLAAQFLDALEYKLAYIQQAPFHYQFRYRNVRTAVLEQFPYSIHYTVEDTTLWVLAVLHHKQDYS